MFHRKDVTTALRFQLGARMRNITKIYLDTKFWVDFANVSTGRDSDPANTTLLLALKALVAEGRVICPFSDVLFNEVMRQTDSDSRSATIHLIDELSQGVTLATLEERVAIEASCFLRYNVADLHGVTARDFIWTKMPFVLGNFDVTSTKHSAGDLKTLNDSFKRFMWNVTIQQMEAMSTGESFTDKQMLEVLAEKVNRDISANSSSVKSWKQVYLAEIQGIVEAHDEVLLEVFLDLEMQRSGVNASLGAEEREALKVMLRNMFANCFRSKLNIPRLALPTFHIYAALYASVRVNKGRKMKANDFHDFKHAVGAVPYFDLLLTERSLMATLTNRQLSFEQAFKCKVFRNASQANEYLSELLLA